MIVVSFRRRVGRLFAGGVTLLGALTALSCAGGEGCDAANPLTPECNPDAVAPEPSVVFQSNRHGPVEVYTMNSDGTGVRRLTNNPGVDGGARWAPDGTKIAWSSQQGGAREIWIMNADGSDKRQVTSLGGTTNGPNWSPDGARLVFHRARGDGNFDLYMVNADGSGTQRLTTSGSFVWPSWSPDGSTLAVQWAESTSDCPQYSALPVVDCRSSIALLNPDGTNLRVLPRVGRHDANPNWSPDGTRLVIASIRPNAPGTIERSQIVVMNADGSSPRGITTGTLDEWQPTWSRSTGRIYFIRAFEVYSIRVDGSDMRRLSASPASDVLAHAR
jgi:Tol biopolymer transport system component